MLPQSRFERQHENSTRSTTAISRSRTQRDSAVALDVISGMSSGRCVFRSNLLHFYRMCTVQPDCDVSFVNKKYRTRHYTNRYTVPRADII